MKQGPAIAGRIGKPVRIGPFKSTYRVELTLADGTKEVREVRRIKILDGNAVIRSA
jgi:hypothetical protein